MWYKQSVGNWQRAEVNQSLKNNDLSTTATVFAFHAIFFVFELLHIPVNPLSPLSLIKPTCQPVNIQQKLMLSTSTDTQSGSWRTAQEASLVCENPSDQNRGTVKLVSEYVCKKVSHLSESLQGFLFGV